MAKKEPGEVAAESNKEILAAETKAPAEKISLSAEDFKSLVKEAAAGAVTAAIEGLKPKEVVSADPALKAKADLANLSPEEQAEFLASFGSGACTECGQPAVKGRYSCKGKHVKMCVFPDDPYWGTYFQGCFLNGAKYLSNGPGHLVAVPAENNFKHDISEWVNMERTNAQGKKRSHNSGSIGKDGNQAGFNPYNGPGFRG